MLALRFGRFNGIGVYPDWNNPGLHLDKRSIDDGMILTWVRYKGAYIYNPTFEQILFVQRDIEKSKKTFSKKEVKE